MEPSIQGLIAPRTVKAKAIPVQLFQKSERQVLRMPLIQEQQGEDSGVLTRLWIERTQSRFRAGTAQREKLQSGTNTVGEAG